MTDEKIYYLALRGLDDPSVIATIAAYTLPDNDPLEGVVWDATRKTWIYAPGIVVDFVYDDAHPDDAFAVSRDDAEQIAAAHMSTELPTEAIIRQMFVEGRRSGLIYGPSPE